VDSFNDPMIDNKDSKKRYRADVLLEERAAGLAMNGAQKEADALMKQMGALLESGNLEGVRQLIIDHKIVARSLGRPIGQRCANST
jgi:glycyl-tRNA synthetase